MKKLGKILLFLSSYILLFIILLINEISIFTLSDVRSIYNICLIIFYCILIILAIMSLIIFKKDYAFGSIKDKTLIKIESVSGSGSEIISYLVTMVIPLISTQSISVLLSENSWAKLFTMFFIIFFVAILYINSSLIVVNPLLVYFGYNINKIVYSYEKNSEIKFEGVLLSNKKFDLGKIKKDVLVDEIEDKVFFIRRV